MKAILLPALLAIGGAAAGIGAGLMLTPDEAAPEVAACDPEAEECVEAPAPAMVASARPGPPSEFVPLDKPFVIPVFDREKVTGMVVLSLAVDAAPGQAQRIATLQPRLRDGLLAVMFRHANSGGFDGSFTAGPKMADLKAALLAATREVLPGVEVHEVLVTEIVRQDV